MKYRQYLVGDLDEEDKDDYDKQVAAESHNTNDYVDDFECKVSDVQKVWRNSAVF